jgi:hypothetical protein
MSGFSIDWLDLREPADRHARNQDLLADALTWLLSGTGTAPLAVDLGAGTGSTLRAVSQYLPAHRDNGTGSHEQVPDATEPDAPQAAVTWRLVDHDPVLLAEAARRHGGQWQLETCRADFGQPGTLPLQNARMVTASALFDLVSAGFVDSLVDALQAQATLPGKVTAAVYAALNYDGRTSWTPPHPLDNEVLKAFNRDQRRDKGMGPALGPDATTAMTAAFERAGFKVTTGNSPWKLTGEDSAMLAALISGIYDAVRQDPALDQKALEEWRQFREQHVATGTCEVGHQDFLALPVS